MRTICFVILGLIAVPALPCAFASQAPGAPVVDPSLALASPPDQGTGNPDPGAAEDPHADRGVLLPTALTQPAGTVSLSSYELLLAGLTVGITDRLQASITGLVPVFGSQAVLGNVKFQVLRHDALRLSLNGGVSYVQSEQDEDHHHPGSEPSASSELRPHLGASVSLCLTDDCQSLLGASVQFLTAFGNRSLEAGYGASLITRMTEHTKLVLEASSNAELRPALAQPQAAVVSGALRYFNGRVALDGGLMVFTASQEILIPLPYVAGSVRF